MDIPFYNFTDLHNENFRTQIKDRFSEIIDKNAFVEGKYNDLFEKEFAAKQSTKHCLLVANGTDALEIALRAYDIKAGDKVGVPAITFYATAEAVENIGAQVVFIDIDPQTGLISSDSLKNVLKEHKLKAIIPVHIYGLPAPIKELEEICHPLNIKIIEDAAQAAGTFYKENSPVGASSNLVTFSFYPTKNLSAFGDAGCILTQDDELAEKIKSLRNHGRSPQGVKLCGRNSRCDHLQAAVLHLKLQTTDELNENRKAIAGKYFKALKNLPIGLIAQKYISLSSWHLYPVIIKDKKEKYELSQFLKENQIGNSPIYYDEAVSDLAPFKHCFKEATQARQWAQKSLCLPMNPFLTDEQVEFVSNKIRDFYQ